MATGPKDHDRTPAVGSSPRPTEEQPVQAIPSPSRVNAPSASSSFEHVSTEHGDDLGDLSHLMSLLRLMDAAAEDTDVDSAVDVGDYDDADVSGEPHGGEGDDEAQ